MRSASSADPLLCALGSQRRRCCSCLWARSCCPAGRGCCHRDVRETGDCAHNQQAIGMIQHHVPTPWNPTRSRSDACRIRAIEHRQPPPPPQLTACPRHGQHLRGALLLCVEGSGPPGAAPNYSSLFGMAEPLAVAEASPPLLRSLQRQGYHSRRRPRLRSLMPPQRIHYFQAVAEAVSVWKTILLYDAHHASLIWAK